MEHPHLLDTILEWRRWTGSYSYSEDMGQVALTTIRIGPFYILGYLSLEIKGATSKDIVIRLSGSIMLNHYT
jgi:hypothetical protein